MPTKKPFPSSVEIKRMIAAAPTNKIKGLNVKDSLDDYQVQKEIINKVCVIRD